MTEDFALREAGILDIPSPLRPDFVATPTVPRDMTTVETKRLAEWIKTLARPTESEEPKDGE